MAFGSQTPSEKVLELDDATIRFGCCYYINTDLDLVSCDDLSPLAAIFDERADLLDCGQYGDGKWYATIEASGSGVLEEDRGPDHDIRELLRVVAGLDEAAARSWRGCEKREFNIGWQAAERRPEGSFSIDAELLREIAHHDATLAVTIYPSCENDRTA
ncbi:MAG: hypothetical protein WD069_22490 [Planctomycetales bacterium]